MNVPIFARESSIWVLVGMMGHNKNIRTFDEICVRNANEAVNVTINIITIIITSRSMFEFALINQR